MVGMAILVVAAGSALGDLPVVVYEDVAFIEGAEFSDTPFMVAEYGLYDHQADPNEWTNLSCQGEYESVKQELSDALPQGPAPFLRKKSFP